jgi:hypothetical protein
VVEHLPRMPQDPGFDPSTKKEKTKKRSSTLVEK